MKLKFKSFEESIAKKVDDMPLDPNLAIADFEKIQNAQTSHLCFQALDKFRADQKRWPKVWNLSDAQKFVAIAKSIALENKMSEEDMKEDSEMVRMFYLYSFQCQGVFSPLCAFMGGLVAQECIKAITSKFSPVHQLFYYDAVEVLPEFNVEKHVKGVENDDKDPKEVSES